MTPSKLHSYLERKLAAVFDPLPQFTAFLNLTLDIGGEDYIPDLCVYPHMPIDFAEDDVVRMTDLPVMVVEIVSPSQTIQEVLSKFPVYFQAGIRSCWLVVPQTKTISVYTAPNQGQIFNTGDVVDPALDVRLPLSQIFA